MATDAGSSGDAGRAWRIGESPLGEPAIVRALLAG
jgi:hypothetical protein